MVEQRRAHRRAGADAPRQARADPGDRHARAARAAGAAGARARARPAAPVQRRPARLAVAGRDRRARARGRPRRGRPRAGRARERARRPRQRDRAARRALRESLELLGPLHARRASRARGRRRRGPCRSRRPSRARPRSRRGRARSEPGGARASRPARPCARERGEPSRTRAPTASSVRPSSAMSSAITTSRPENCAGSQPSSSTGQKLEAAAAARAHEALLRAHAVLARAARTAAPRSAARLPRSRPRAARGPRARAPARPRAWRSAPRPRAPSTARAAAARSSRETRADRCRARGTASRDWHRIDPMPVEPVPAATVMLLRDSAAGPEVLLLERHAKSEFLPDAYVFPGGRVDDEDHALGGARRGQSSAAQASAALRTVAPELALGFFVAAIRETYEESGILLARRRGSDELLDAASAGRARAPPARRPGGRALVPRARPGRGPRARGGPPRRARALDHARGLAAPLRHDLLRGRDAAGATGAARRRGAHRPHLDAARARPLRVPRRQAPDDPADLGEPRDLARLRLRAASAAPRRGARSLVPILPVLRERDGKRRIEIPAGAGYPTVEELLG